MTERKKAVRQRRKSDPYPNRNDRSAPQNIRSAKPFPRPQSFNFHSLPKAISRSRAGSLPTNTRLIKPTPKPAPYNPNVKRIKYDEELPNVPSRIHKVQRTPVVPSGHHSLEYPEAVAVLSTRQARFTPDMQQRRQQSLYYSTNPVKFNPARFNGDYDDPNRLVAGARFPTERWCGACNSSFLITIWGFLKILECISSLIILMCASVEATEWDGVLWVIFIAVLGVFVSLGTLVFHLIRGHLKERRLVLFTEFCVYLFVSLCILSAAILATIQTNVTGSITCITIVGYIATLLFGIDTVITGSWIGARTYILSDMRPRPVLYPPNYQPNIYYPKPRKDFFYERPPILLDPWEKKIHYNDYRPTRYNFNLNNPHDARLPDTVDVRYYNNKATRYLKPLYGRDYRFPEDYDYDDIRTAPIYDRYHRRPREFQEFLSFPDRDYRRYQREIVKPLREEDLVRDDSRTHLPVYHPRQPNKLQFPKVYHHKHRNWKFPDYDDESRIIDFTSENELESNMPSVGTQDDSLKQNYHRRQDYKLPNFKSYDDWRIQKHRAKQLSTIPAKQRQRREHFWSVDSIPTENRRRTIPNFKTYADWNVPRDRPAISTVPNPFPDKDDYPSTVAPVESRVGENFSTTPFPDRSLIDTSSLIRPYKPKPRPDPDLQDQKSVNSRNDPAPGIPPNRSIREDRISNRGSDNLSIAANRSTDSQRMQPIFNKEKPPKTRKSVGSV